MARQGRHGATRRQPKTSKEPTFERWLDRWLDTVVTVAVVTALVIGISAVIAHWVF
ncbi:hypothetical protein [Halomonas dongshanensis]|uniref:RDD family protein n=1 Tax=Halomonas dongshanensis TaxID=2890835 RepID=A0ABT2EH60_9GAMM|nr:hypothetical protein [Halomonas dongshanensis]MCS2610952.1 hypothetical protein [Halomonas dongshanensis]